MASRCAERAASISVPAVVLLLLGCGGYKEAQRAPGGDVPGTAGAPAAGEAAPGAETRVASAASVAAARMVIYTAQVAIEVASIEPVLRQVRELAQGIGGRMQELADSRITLRVPAHEFEPFLDRLSKLGDVVSRAIKGSDITEEFLDLDIRLKNALATRDRLAELLSRAQNVKDALEIQKELGRITEEIERMKGRMQYLRDQVAFATVTVELRVRRLGDASLPGESQNPFGWVRDLGLHAIFDLREQP